MAGMRKKTDLPIKTCPACNRPFTWRKKWAKDWEQVVYCSKACRGQGRADTGIGQLGKANKK